jgi:hypothetical protein
MGRPLYDWKKIATAYITGDDSFETLSQREGYPSYIGIAKRAAKEKWVDQRKLYRQRSATVDVLTVTDKDIKAAANQIDAMEQKVSKLLDEVEMLTRHVNIAKVIQSKGYAALQRMDIDTLKPGEILSYLKQGSDLERLAMGLATEKIDIENVSDEELEKLAHGG